MKKRLEHLRLPVDTRGMSTFWKFTGCIKDFYFCPLTVSSPSAQLSPPVVTANIAKDRCHPDLCHYFFSSRVIDRSNSLPQSVTDSNSLNSFKNGIDKMRNMRMGFCMDYPVRRAQLASPVLDSWCGRTRYYTIRHLPHGQC